jgi:hypothetical protein
MLLSVIVASFSTFVAGRVFAQPGQNGDGPGNDGPPVYQNHPTDGHQMDGHSLDKRRRDDRRDRRDFRRGFPFMSPQISSAWFQRPYPYHLDYYKMRYGGSYAPYFGNLYGPSGFPAYYGPYYGGYGGYGAGYANGYPQPGYNGGPMEYPVTGGTEMPEDGAEEVPLPAQVQPGAAAATPSGGTVPTVTP